MEDLSVSRQRRNDTQPVLNGSNLQIFLGLPIFSPGISFRGCARDEGPG